MINGTLNLSSWAVTRDCNIRIPNRWIPGSRTHSSIP